MPFLVRKSGWTYGTDKKVPLVVFDADASKFCDSVITEVTAPVAMD